MEIEKKNPIIILLAAKARSGKDVVANIINSYFSDNKKIIDLKYAFYIKEYAKKISDWDGSEETKPRTLLQQLGTEIIRQKIDSEIFVRRMVEDIKVFSYFFDVITISDVRTVEEIETPKKSFDKVYSINIIRPNMETDLTEAEQKHFIETALDNYNNYDFTIINDGNLEELQNKVIEIMDVINNEH